MKATEFDFDQVEDVNAPGLILISSDLPAHDEDGRPTNTRRLDNYSAGDSVEDESGNRFTIMGCGSMQGSVVLLDPNGRMYQAEGSVRVLPIGSDPRCIHGKTMGETCGYCG